MTKKLWKNVMCIAMACVMFAATALATPTVVQADCGQEIPPPRGRILDEVPRKD